MPSKTTNKTNPSPALPPAASAPPVEASPPPAEASPLPVEASAPPSKISTVISLLGREQGASVAELCAATGWLPHTMRAALTGLRKKGRAIEKASLDGVTLYRIQQAG